MKIYLKLKQLMYEIDEIEESSDEEGHKTQKGLLKAPVREIFKVIFRIF